jgi:hypothetical protein
VPETLTIYGFDCPEGIDDDVYFNVTPFVSKITGGGGT